MNIFSTRNVLAVGIIAVLVGAYYLSGSTLFRAPEVKADASQNVSGYAWSENIGWISFNSTNEASGSSYGVNIDPLTGSGVFSGKAWSENIGWISFDTTDLTGCPSGVCSARVDWSTGKVAGWARVLSAAGSGSGWDGWVKLSDDSVGVWNGNGVKISPVDGKFSGYAWGGSDSAGVAGVVGWIDFSPAIAGENTVHIPVSPPTTCPPAPFAYSGVCNLSPADLLTCTPGATGLAGLETGTCTIDASSHDYRACSTAECPTPPPAVCDGDKTCEAGETFKTCPSDCKMKFFQF